MARALFRPLKKPESSQRARFPCIVTQFKTLFSVLTEKLGDSHFPDPEYTGPWTQKRAIDFIKKILLCSQLICYEEIGKEKVPLAEIDGFPEGGLSFKTFSRTELDHVLQGD